MSKIKNLFTKISNISKNNKGFSLTELMITMSIIGSVGTLAGAQIDDILPMARDAQRKANIYQVQTALNIYYDDRGQYPISFGNEPTEAGWRLIKDVLESSDNPENVYVPEMPADPLNTGQYVFKYWSDGQKFKITYETEDSADQSPRTAWGL
ncbi:MAG: prepilin-type N-terminal cleavage/methylation domain-containing protein [bacterium]|nr:prepilin-type N-terminal cleavage/methylation domain-containing protein [bacterium]